MNCFLLAAGSPLPTADAKAGKYFSGAKKVYYEVLDIGGHRACSLGNGSSEGEQWLDIGAAIGHDALEMVLREDKNLLQFGAKESGIGSRGF